MKKWLLKYLLLTKDEFCKLYGHDDCFKESFSGVSPKELKIIRRHVYECRWCKRTRLKDKVEEDFDIKKGIPIGGSEGICPHCKKYKTCTSKPSEGATFVYHTCPITDWEPTSNAKKIMKNYGDTLIG